jgi:hypothetical protein
MSTLLGPVSGLFLPQEPQSGRLGRLVQVSDWFSPLAPPLAPVAALCASAKVLDSAKAVAIAIVPNFMVVSFLLIERRINRLGSFKFRRHPDRRR